MAAARIESTDDERAGTRACGRPGGAMRLRAPLSEGPGEVACRAGRNVGSYQHSGRARVRTDQRVPSWVGGEVIQCRLGQLDHRTLSGAPTRTIARDPDP